MTRHFIFKIAQNAKWLLLVFTYEKSLYYIAFKQLTLFCFDHIKKGDSIVKSGASNQYYNQPRQIVLQLMFGQDLNLNGNLRG